MKTTFKFMEDGLWTKSNKIILIVTGVLFAIAVGLSIVSAAAIGFFGLDSDIPAQLSIAPYAVFFALLVLATIGTVFAMIVDMIVNNNYNEYVELLKRVPKNTQTKEDGEFLHYIFDEEHLPNN